MGYKGLYSGSTVTNLPPSQLDNVVWRVILLAILDNTLYHHFYRTY